MNTHTDKKPESTEWSEADQIRTQSERESRIMDFAFEQTQNGRDKFVERLHMFFSPHMIPDELTVGQARMLYLLALHFDGRPRNAIASQLSNEGKLQVRIIPHGGDLLPEEWQYCMGDKMTEEKFLKGLEKFMNQNLANDGR